MQQSKSRRPELSKSPVIEAMPAACAAESLAAEFLEAQRWGGKPFCPHADCGCTDVYPMKGRDGKRNRRFLWRCRGCSKMFTVRTNSVLAESLLPLTKWCHALWMMASAKNCVSALELSRQLQISYKSALFLAHRLRHAMAPRGPQHKLVGTVEADETYVGGKPRGPKFQQRGPRFYRPAPPKTPVLAVLQRGGDVRATVTDGVTSRNLREFLTAHVEFGTQIMTDDLNKYRPIAQSLGPHGVVNHSIDQYVHPDYPSIHTQTVESFFARVKRGLNGTYHAVSKAHLHRYIAHFAFLHNTRGLNDGERAVALIRGAGGKRLMYREPVKRAG